MIFQRKHNWLMCWLYTGTFGSFIGYSAGFPLLAKTQFPEVNALQFVFLGPLVGALSRSGDAAGSPTSYGGGRVTFWVFVADDGGVLGVIFFLGIKDQPGAFWGFFAMFLVLFFATGVGNASTFQMIPVIMREGNGPPDARQPTPRRAAGRPSIEVGGDHRLHLGDRGLWRLLHPQGLRHVDRADRRAGGGALGVPRLLRDLPRHHLGRLHPPGRAAARHRARASWRRRCQPAAAD